MIEAQIKAFFEKICKEESDLRTTRLTGSGLMTASSQTESEELSVPVFKLRRVLSGSQDMDLIKGGAIVDLEATFEENRRRR